MAFTSMVNSVCLIPIVRVVFYFGLRSLAAKKLQTFGSWCCHNRSLRVISMVVRFITSFLHAYKYEVVR